MRRVIQRSIACLLMAGAVTMAQQPAAGPALVAGVDIKATLITLHAKDEIAEDVYKALGKQVKVRFLGIPDNILDQKLSIDLDNVPFWDALRQLNAKTELRENTNGRDTSTDGAIRPIYLAQAGEQDLRPTQAVGPFVVHIEQIQVSRSKAYDDATATPATGTVRLSIEAEPSLQLAGYAPFPMDVVVADQAGRTLTSSSPANIPITANTRKEWSWNTNVTWRDQAGGAPDKVTIRATFQATISEGTKTFEVADPLTAGPKSIDQAGGTITFSSLKPVDANDPNNRAGMHYSYVAEVTIEVPRGARAPGAAQTSPAQLAQYLSSAQLFDKDGLAYQTNRSPVVSRPPGQAGGDPQVNSTKYLAYFAPVARTEGTVGEPTKFSLSLPMGGKLVKIPVEFKDVPLK